MNKLCSILLSILAVFTALHFFPSKVLAEDVYTCSSKSMATFNSDFTTDYSQLLTVKNLSTQFVVHYFDLFLPFNVSDVKASINKANIIVQNDQGHIKLDLENNFIGPQTEVNIEITFIASHLIKQVGSFKTLYLPQMDYCNNGSSSVTFNYPQNWGTPSYISSSEVFEKDGSYMMGSNTDLYMVFGKISPIGITANWELRSGKIIPMPSSNFNNFAFTSVPNASKVFKDIYGNEYLEIDPNYDFSSSFSGKLTPLSDIKLLDNGEKYTESIDVININTDQEVDQIYQALIEKFEPKVLRGFSRPKTLANILSKQSQDSFDYAYTFANLLEAKGLKVNIFYGLTRLPINEEYIWHFWVGFEDQGKLNWADPFFDDLFQFRSLGDITPDRVIWGIYTKENDYILDSLWNFNDPNSIVTNQNLVPDEEQVLGDNIGATAELMIKNDFARQLGVMVTNNGNNVIYIDQLLVNREVDATGSFQHLGILPKQSKYLDLTGYVSPKALLSWNGKLQANLKFSTNGKVFEVSSNTSLLQSFNLYLLFFALIFVLFVVSAHTVRLNLHKFRRQKN